MKKVYTVSRVDAYNNSKEYANKDEEGTILFFQSKELAEGWIKEYGDKYALYSIDKMYHNVLTEEEEVIEKFKEKSSEQKYSRKTIISISRSVFSMAKNGFTLEQAEEFINGILK